MDVATTTAAVGVIAGLIGALVASAGPKLSPSRVQSPSKRPR